MVDDLGYRPPPRGWGFRLMFILVAIVLSAGDGEGGRRSGRRLCRHRPGSSTATGGRPRGVRRRLPLTSRPDPLTPG